MTARGPYYVDKDAWVAQLVSGTTQYGNGSGTLIMLGPAPNLVAGDPDLKSRGMFEISAADVTAYMADATSIGPTIIELTVGPNTCIGSRGSAIRLLLEEMTVDFTENAKTGCNVSSGTGTAVWGQSNNVTITNRAFYSGSPGGGDTITFDVTDLFEARRVAGNLTSAFRFRVIAANATGTGYDETNAARRLSVYAREGAPGTHEARLSGTVTVGNVAKSMSDVLTFTEAFSLTQAGTSPTFADVLNLAETFSGGPGAGWTTGFDANGNGRASLHLPSPGIESFAILPAVSAQDIVLRARCQLDKIPSGGSVSFDLLSRTVDKNTTYRARIYMGGNLHDIGIVLEKVVGGVVTALQYVSDIRALVAATDFWVKMQVEGINPTTLNAKLWRWGESEPGWVLQAQDSEAALQAAGAVGIGGRISTTVVNVPLTMEIDQLEGYAP